MRVDIQIKINNDPKLKTFIRQYPDWYKKLNRNPNLYKDFVNDMKTKYKITTGDRINKTLNNISMLQMFLDVLR